MICVKCGAKIPDGYEFCMNCGTKASVIELAEISPDQQTNQSNALQAPKRGKTKYIVLGIALLSPAIVAIVLCILVFLIINGSDFNEREKYALDCVSELNRMDGGINLEGDVFYSETDDGTYVVFDYSCNRRIERAYFVNKKYIGTESDYEENQRYEMSDVKYGIITRDEYLNILEENLGFSGAKAQIALWRIAGDSDTRFVISGKKIARKLKIKYSSSK